MFPQTVCLKSQLDSADVAQLRGCVAVARCKFANSHLDALWPSCSECIRVKNGRCYVNFTCRQGLGTAPTWSTDAQQLHCSNTNILHTYVAKLHIAYTPRITYNTVLYYAGDQPAVYHYIMHVSVPTYYNAMFGILCTGAQQTYHVSYVPTYYDVWYFTPHTPSNSSFSATSNSYFWLPQPTSPWFQVSSMFTMSPN